MLSCVLADGWEMVGIRFVCDRSDQKGCWSSAHEYLYVQCWLYGSYGKPLWWRIKGVSLSKRQVNFD